MGDLAFTAIVTKADAEGRHYTLGKTEKHLKEAALG